MTAQGEISQETARKLVEETTPRKCMCAIFVECGLHNSASAMYELLREVTNHADRFGAVPKSADKLWARVNSALAKAEGGA